MTNQTNNQGIIPSTDVKQLTLTLKMTTAQVVETSVTVNNNSPIQDYVQADDQTQPLEFCNSRLQELYISIGLVKSGVDCSVMNRMHHRFSPWNHNSSVSLD